MKIILIFTHAIKEEFKDIAHVDWHFTIQNTSNQDEHVIKYFDIVLNTQLYHQK